MLLLSFEYTVYKHIDLYDKYISSYDNHRRNLDFIFERVRMSRKQTANSEAKDICNEGYPKYLLIENV